MDRREALGFFGATALGIAVAESGQARPDDSHKHAEHFDMCARACTDCQKVCDSCFHHCAMLVARGEKDHARSMHSCIDCAEVCATAARLTARHSPTSVVVCDACAKVCDSCAADCEKNKSDQHMAACAKSCRDCARACREMIKQLT